MQVILFDDFLERNCYDYCLTVLNARVAKEYHDSGELELRALKASYPLDDASNDDY